jgi:DNA polymerase-3 subunit alpha
MVQSQHTVPFVHLRVQSAYSIGVGVSTPTEICAHAARSGFDAVALTDVGGTWGWPEFHRAARRYGIKPVYGVTLGLNVGEKAGDGIIPLVLVALDRAGLRNVSALASLSDAAETGDPFVEVSQLVGRTEGVVCVINPPEFESDQFGPLIEASDPVAEFAERAQQLQTLFTERLFYGLAPGFDDPEVWIQKAYDLGITAVVMQDVRYVGFKHYALAAVEKATDHSEPAHPLTADGEPIDRYRFLSMSEVAPWYGRYAAAYANASLIASQVKSDLLDRLDEAVPASDSPPLLDGGVAGEYQGALEEIAKKQFDRRFAAAPAAEKERYGELLAGELEAIRESEGAEPFLRFHEIVSKLRGLGIPLGPSTGLRLQSLTAYLLGITTFNPYEVDEQFVPDLAADSERRRILDLQIASADREATVSVVGRLFDGVGVGYVPTVEHVTPLRALKAASRDVDVDESDLALIVKITGDHPGVSLKKLCEENREIGRLYRRSPAVRELVGSAATIEGLPIGFIRSKRTLLVSPRPLKEYLGHSAHPQTGEIFFQATRDAFPAGAVFRVDLSTLTSLGVCARVAEFLRGREEGGWEWTRPTGTVQETADEFAHVANGDVDGVFLLESPLTQRLAVDFGVTTFGELTRFLALMRFRRGDLSFAARVEAYKKGTPSQDELDPAIAFLLNDTAGWVLFDDQLREILSVLTARPGLDAVSLLRRFKKHDAGTLAELRRDFMGRAVETELPMEEAESWFKRILYYATRTIDRQNIVADALLVYRMLRLKHHHRAAFFAALLNEHRGRGSRFDVYLGIVEAEGLLLAPTVNRSGREYLPEKGLIRAPLSAIDGLDGEAVEAILAARGGGRFENLEDLLRRVSSDLITNKEIESIVSAGAVETGGEWRASGAPARHQTGEHTIPQEVTDAGQFELSLDAGQEPREGDRSTRPPVAPTPPSDGNIRGRFLVVPTLAEFYPHSSGTRVELVGRVRDLHSFKTSSGDETCFFVLFDTSTSVPVFVPRGRFGRAGEPPADGDRVVVRGYVRTRDRRRVCDAVEVLAEGGAISNGETTTDEPPEGNP